ncbi:MAG: hypothetical protein AAB601_03025, partial [Patescibacteria group bacterium]
VFLPLLASADNLYLAQPFGDTLVIENVAIRGINGAGQLMYMDSDSLITHLIIGKVTRIEQIPFDPLRHTRVFHLLPTPLRRKRSGGLR